VTLAEVHDHAGRENRESVRGSETVGDRETVWVQRNRETVTGSRNGEGVEGRGPGSTRYHELEPARGHPRVQEEREDENRNQSCDSGKNSTSEQDCRHHCLTDKVCTSPGARPLMSAWRARARGQPGARERMSPAPTERHVAPSRPRKSWSTKVASAFIGDEGAGGHGQILGIGMVLRGAADTC